MITEVLVSLTILLSGFFLIIIMLGRSYAGWLGIVLIGLSLRVALAIMDRYYIDLPQSSSDAKVFFRFAVEFASLGCGNLSGFDVSMSYVYSALIGQLFACVGESMLGMQFINCIAGVVGGIAAARAAAHIWGRMVASNVLLLLNLFPTLILYSAVTLRESLIFMLFCLSVFHFVKYLSARSVLNLIFSVLYIFMASALHSGMLFALFGLVFVISLGLGDAKSRSNGVGKVFLNLILGVVLVSSLYYYTRSTEINKFGNLGDVDVAFVSSVLEGRGEGGAAYLVELSINSPSDLLLQAPIRVFYFIFSPMPWDVRTPAHLFGLIDAVFWWYLAFRIVKHRRVIFSNRSALALFLVVSVLMVVFAFGTSNFGTAMRHRAKFVPILFVIAAGSVGMARRQRYTHYPPTIGVSGAEIGRNGEGR